MSNSSVLDVFDLREKVVSDYASFARSFTKIDAHDIRNAVAKEYEDGRFWPDPLVQVNPRYKSFGHVDTLVTQGLLHPETRDMFVVGGLTNVHVHQAESISLAAKGESYAVTTGTGSGKSMCFFMPIVDHVVRSKAQGIKGTKAIVIYPMNALANSQLRELEKFLGKDGLVSVKRYTGQDDVAARQDVVDNPPDILLTNFVMLELMMTRQSDRKVIENCSNLRFLVLDELHTYRGRQGADVAMLVRRLKNRVSAPEKMIFIGTSATMSSEGTSEEQRQVVAKVASTLFGIDLPMENVIEETLAPATPQPFQKGAVLAAAIAAPLASDATDDDLRANPLLSWIEGNAGIKFINNRWRRVQPQNLDHYASRLAEDSGMDREACEAALRHALLTASQPEVHRTGKGAERPFMAFKLHQFVSGAGKVYATLAAPEVRTVTLDAQVYDPQTKGRLYETYFCRECGHDYHPVRKSETGFPPRTLDDFVKDDDGDDTDGFLTMDRLDLMFAGDDEDYPEEWLERKADGSSRLATARRKDKAEKVSVGADGKTDAHGAEAWFTRGHFKFCLACRKSVDRSGHDRTALAGLTSEGRSSATTTLSTSVLDWLYDHAPDDTANRIKRKLLCFTDNRQDAALQAGHFNDRSFVALLRAAALKALREAGDEGLTDDRLGAALESALGFNGNAARNRHWLGGSGEAKGLGAQQAPKVLREMLAYRFWVDQRRGWRYTSSNLEDQKLLTVDYQMLSDCAADVDEWIRCGVPEEIAAAPASYRERMLRILLDGLRTELAIDTSSLREEDVEGLKRRSVGLLKSPWGFASEEPTTTSTAFVTRPIQTRKPGEQARIVKGGPQSRIGRKLIRLTKKLCGKLSTKDYEKLLDALVAVCAAYHFLKEVDLPLARYKGDPVRRGWQINALLPKFKVSSEAPPETGRYFRETYERIWTELGRSTTGVFEYEAREHTAQVGDKDRVERERRFRYQPNDVKDLEQEIESRGKGFLPLLVCSPTMELGVDISELFAVMMRNAPPTSANYAQRSGRAGRSGQAAFVLTYCAAQSPHDQYFFERQHELVAGEVRAPSLDLLNLDLIKAHLNAVWLAETGIDLDRMIPANLMMSDAQTLALKEEIRTLATSPEAKDRAKKQGLILIRDIAPEGCSDVPRWLANRKGFVDGVVDACPTALNDAFDRWREMWQTSDRQHRAANRTSEDTSASKDDRLSAKRRAALAWEKMRELERGDSASSDFYTYRYLATEGFLPGYNFPRLPVRAFIRGVEKGQGQYLQRPRFLAISEFGPRSLIYHEGRSHRVMRADLGPGSRADDSNALAKKHLKLCGDCGASHEDDGLERCHVCGAELSGADVVTVCNALKVDAVSTQPTLRISSNDEERRKAGADVRTTFDVVASRNGGRDLQASVTKDGMEICHALYAPAADITRINLGLRSRKEKDTHGYWIDPPSGRWIAGEDEEGGEGENDLDKGELSKVPPDRVSPSVHDNKNALLLRGFLRLGVDDDDRLTVMASLQQALKRAVEIIYQLDDGEIQAEPMPTRSNRKAILLYEATDGGAGVLNRIAHERDALPEIARRALQLAHYDLPVVDGKVATTFKAEEIVDNRKDQCVAGCYRCLLSYANQPDHEAIDRRNEAFKSILVDMACGVSTVAETDTVEVETDYATATPTSLTEILVEAGIPKHDVNTCTVSLVWKAKRVAIMTQDDAARKERLEDLGYTVFDLAGAFPDAETMVELKKAFGV